ncbi:MAG: hypothetical protein A2431_04180 [Candidatus Zambryskibacteria bacterium RIFOXYC1_FULL_39_10]|uniref:Fibronectin type-III domain-containing protein n=1 Tax=Candidatus Zambryskibacteria bacterium RIFOXYC1_FULL_39_10 TaxID=1802779 RepID=A0A1G2UZ21_9BACT|nr:MAG: hypothetical protein A2431_04180 [Candidatus Zambryskibacteria bacterium RIFOXYC1_FULL_39_10]OHB16658.1 MAG: hypothetical protein A2605_00680 [Candidatus Zambryskibacteria bacterium RIFOXYD1_FULL_39_35]
MMQKIFSYKYLFLGLLISVLIPFSFAHADPGDTSITIPPDYAGGQVTVTVEAVGGQTAALTVILNPPNPTPCTVLNSSLSASPDPILVGSGVSTGITTISANATCAYDIRINSTSGSTFAQEGPGAWSGPTGNWVSNGTVFYLQKRGDSTAEGTLKTETVNLIAIPTVTLTPSTSSITLPTNSFTLTWTTTDSPTSCTASGSWSGSKITTGGSQTITVLTAGTYTYNLTCTNTAGTSSIKTTTVVVNPVGVVAPNTPTGFSAVASVSCGTGQINLSWNASSGATSYTLKRDGSTIYTGSGLSYSDTGLTAGSNHSYTVSASNSAGTSATASASANAPAACVISVPNVTFTANPISMTLPTTNSTTLTWSSTNSPTSCTASSNPVNSNWNGAKSTSGGSQVISGLTAGSKIFYLYCTNSGGNSITQSQTVNVINAGAPNPDLKGTIYENWTGDDRTAVWNAYSNINGPVNVYNKATYALSWPAVSNATSCTLDGSPVSVSGGTINTYIATLTSKTHTLSCTGAGGTTVDTFVLTIPPMPTNPIGTCPTPYTAASLSWTAPAGYNTFFVRLNEYVSPTENGYTWPPDIATEVIGTTWTPATTPGQSYTWWISTKNTGNGAWSEDVVSYNLVCNVATFPLTVTKAGTGTGTITPSTGTISWSGNTGTATYNSGTSVTLTAAATGGSTFTGWSGGLCSGTGTCVVSMTQARDVTATFTASTMSGTLTPPTTSCTIASGASSCNVTMSWTTTNPVGTSAITSNYPSSGTTVASGDTGTNVPLAVPYLSSPRTFYLYNNSVLLAQSTATASCISGTVWDSGSGKCVLSGGGGSASCNTTDWYATNGWNYRKVIVIDKTKVSSDQSNFPVLISTTIGTSPQTNGEDILFTNSDGKTKLSHEIEKYNDTTGELIAWVKIPTLYGSASVNTNTIYMYYGNSGASNQQNVSGTWDANFKGVWHLPNGTTLSATDTIGNGNGSVVGTPTAGTGKIDGSMDIDSTGDYINAGNSSEFNFTSNAFTIEAWIKPPASGQANYQTFIARGTYLANGWYIQTDNSVNKNGVWFVTNTAGSNRLTQAANKLTLSAWNHVAAVRNGTSVRIYVNGTDQTTSAGSHVDPVSISTNLIIGKWLNGMDEVRISNTNRSADWIKTEYNNQSSPSTFISISEQCLPSNSSTVTINAGDTDIPYNTSTTITWSSTGATSCSVSPTGWTGLSGTQPTGNLTTSKTYTLSCNPGPVTDDVTVNVETQSSYAINVIKSGQGTVVSSPAGINCGTGCSSQSSNFLSGTSVTLTASPSSGRIFTGWGGSCSGNGTCTIIVSNPATVFANFAIDPTYKEF